MAKSGGNAVSAVKATEQYGADVLRLYVASMDYADDVRMSERGIKEMSESYRKIRNTFRYLLGNLEDYARLRPRRPSPAETLHEIDRWALGQLNRVIEDVTAAYERFEFYRVYQRIYQFCAVDLSSFYLDVLKDRLYAEAPDGPDRRAAQFVLARLHDALARLLAPIIPHTAEELWDFLPDGARQAGERPPGRVARARPDLGRPRARRADGPPPAGPRGGAPRPGEAAGRQGHRQQPGGEGPADRPRVGPDRALRAGPRPVDLPVHRLGDSPRRPRAGGAARCRSRRDRRGGRAVGLRQVRAVLEPPPERRPGRRAPDLVRPLRPGRRRLARGSLTAMPDLPRDPPILDPPIRLAVCVSGGGTTLQNLIDLIGAGRLDATIVQVIASKPGIGAIPRAEAAGLPLAVATRGKGDLAAFSASVFDPIRRSRADLVILAGFLALVQIPDDYVGRVINIHPSLIPAFCGRGFHGRAVHQAALDSGVKVSGCTVHFADATYDTGPIILQRVVPVEDDDTPETLAARVFQAECQALPEAIALYAQGRLRVEGRRVRVLEDR